MLRTRLGIPIAVALAAVLVTTMPAAADSESGGGAWVSGDLDTGGTGSHGGATVDVGAEHSTTRPGSGGGATQQAGSRSPSKGTCTFSGEEIPCTGAFGVWSRDLHCWVQRLSPQPPADYPGWVGHTGGAIYMCTAPGFTGAGDYAFWAPAAGAAGAPALVDPVTLAEEAIDSMSLVGPRVGATPLRPAAPGVVGVQTWLWVDNAGPAASGPTTRTARAGPVSVTATAKVTKVVWEMGDGTEVTCRNAGTEWTPADGGQDSPTCGHTYRVDSGDQPGDAYQVSATSHWQVDWDGSGQSGTIRFTLTGPARAMPVVELQALRST